MSDFFAGIQNARFPDVVMNQGPLPPTSGLPAPLHDDADARINQQTSLLGNLAPYAYGEPGYQSSQVSYVNHPHRIQKIFPEIRLPRGTFNALDDFPVSHPVDDSDIAFVLRLDRASRFCSLLKNPTIQRYHLGTAIDPFINLATLNYILAGLQLAMCRPAREPHNLWKTLLHDLDKDLFNDDYFAKNDYVSLNDLFHIVRSLITPFGVVRGSEKQGGQNEATQSPATWPVNFVGTLVIDGKERNVLNYWYNKDIDAGDDLCLRMKLMPIPKNGYTLSHYYKHVARQDFRLCTNVQGVVENSTTHVWQLVPDVFSLCCTDKIPETAKVANFKLQCPPNYRWQEWGYWHIGRTQVRAGKTSATGDYYNDDMAMNLKIGHLDMTFAPCWNLVPGKTPFEPQRPAEHDDEEVPDFVGAIRPRMTTDLSAIPEEAASLWSDLRPAKKTKHVSFGI